jgi:hypothetical protein
MTSNNNRVGPLDPELTGRARYVVPIQRSQGGQLQASA